jgi:hypothetical protein
VSRDEDALRVGYNVRLGDYSEQGRVSSWAHALSLHMHMPSLKIVMQPYSNIVSIRFVSSKYIVMSVVVIQP